ncbi:MAG: hypothetical protein ABJB55_02475 [Actinomycetota bacterium]
MRRVLGVLAATLLAVGAVLVVPPAQAQGNGVTLQLLRQSPWSSAYHRSMLNIDVLAHNGGSDALTDQHVTVSFGPHVESRANYAATLTSGPSSIVDSESESVRGDLAPGDNRTIGVAIDLATVAAIDQTDSQTYPAMVQLFEGDTVVATLTTSVIYLVRPPEKPMLSATWLQFPAPIAFGADGALVDPSFSAALGPGGYLRSPLDALADVTIGAHPHGPFDLVIDPLVVSQARDLADGFRTADGTEVTNNEVPARQADAFVRELSAVVSNTNEMETIANPYASPLLPAMLASGLSEELAGERVAGDTVVGSLGVQPVGGVAHPAAGQLSEDALAWLAGVDTHIVLGDAGTIDRTATQGYAAPAPTVPVATPAGDMTMVLPDPDTQALFDRPDLLGDPVRASQLVLGELAVIWKEAPVPAAPTVRGIAIAPPPTLPPAMWGPLLQRLNEAPFLTPATASELVAGVVPDNPNVAGPLTAPSSAAFDSEYAASIGELGRDVEAYGSMLGTGSDAPTELRRKLFIATAPSYVTDPTAGQPWLTSVGDTTRTVFDAVAPRVSSEFTFTSREGTIQMVMGDPGPTPLHVTVELLSTQFSFPDGNSQNILVEHPGQIVKFNVVANTSGQNLILVRVSAPNGVSITEPPIKVVVHTTAVNHIALLVTIVAGLGLLALYSRRWFRRRRTPA